MPYAEDRRGRRTPSAHEQWMRSLTVDNIIKSANPSDPASVVSAMRFLLRMGTELMEHGNVVESIKCAESVLVLRRAHEHSLSKFIDPIIEEGLIPSCTAEHAAELVLHCNNTAVAAFNNGHFDVAELLLGKALFLTDGRTMEEVNYFPKADSRRVRLRAATLNNLGCMEKRRGRMEESLRYLRQAVDIEVMLNRTAGAAPSTYLNLCTVLNALQRHDEAVIAVEGAIAALDEQLLRQQHDRQLPNSAMMLVVGLYNLGVSLEHRNRPGDNEKAKASYQRALDTSRRYFVDKKCPTVELAMSAIRRIHANPALMTKRADSHPCESTEAVADVSPPTVLKTPAPSGKMPAVDATGVAAENITSPQCAAPSGTNLQTSAFDKLDFSLRNEEEGDTHPQVVSNVPVPEPHAPVVSERPSQDGQVAGNQELLRIGAVQTQQPVEHTATCEDMSHPQRQPSSDVLSCDVDEVPFKNDRTQTVVPETASDTHQHPMQEDAQRSSLLPPVGPSSNPSIYSGAGFPDAHVPAEASPIVGPVTPQALVPLVPLVPLVRAYEQRTSLSQATSQQSGSDALRAHTMPSAMKQLPSPACSGASLPSPGENASVKGSRVSLSFAQDGSPKISGIAGPQGQKRGNMRPHMLSPLQRSIADASTFQSKTGEFVRRSSLANVLEHKEARKSSKDSTNSQADALSLFGRNRFNVSVAPSKRPTMSLNQPPQMTTQEAAAMEKHLLRAHLGQKKAEEVKGSAVAASRNAALAKLKEKEVKRQAREEAAQDVALAEAMYEKFLEGMRAEEARRCNRAASVIQRIWRGCMARTLLLRMVLAAKRIQRSFRIFLVRLLALRLAEEELEKRRRAARQKQEHEAAVVLQTRVRQFLRRLDILRKYLARKMLLNHAARCIQRGFRDYLEWREAHLAALMEAQRLEDERRWQEQMDAARRIQVIFKHYLKRKEEVRNMLEQNKRERAAELIQARVRGVLARAWFRYYKSYRREQELRSAASQKRIIVIQSFARVAIAERFILRTGIQRMNYIKKQILMKSATKIQCQWRCRIARIRMERLRAERAILERRVTRIKRWYLTRVARRRFLEIRQANRCSAAAVKIQRWYRAMKIRCKEREMAKYYAEIARKARLELIRSQSILFIQACARTRISSLFVQSMRMSFLRSTLYAEKFQRVGRGYDGRRRLFLHKCALIREARERVEADRRERMACVIQRAWRCAMAKEKVAELKRRRVAAGMIAGNFRIYMCRKELRSLRDAQRHKEETKAAIVVQRIARQFLRRLELVRIDEYHRKRQQKMLLLMRREEAATIIQAAWRGYVTRVALLREYGEVKALGAHVSKIQRAWRAGKFRESVNRIVQQNWGLRQHRSRAAVQIQCFWRKMVAAETVARLREVNRSRVRNAVVIQRWWRCVLARWVLQALRMQHEEEIALQNHYMEKWDSFVSLINAFARVKVAQQQSIDLKRRQLLARLTDVERDRFLRRCTAATKIQAMYRGHYERVYARGLRREKEERERTKRERELLEKRSAIVIQQAYRRWRACVIVAELRAKRLEQRLAEELERPVKEDPHEVVRELFWVYESMTKCNLMKERLQRMDKRVGSAMKIQWAVRQWLAKRVATNLRQRTIEGHAALIIQRYWAQFRGRKLMHDLERKRNAATIIQAHYRGYLGRLNLQRNQQQKEQDRKCWAQEENRNDAAATVLQSLWRRYVARQVVLRLRIERQLVKDWHASVEAAIAIQQAYRRRRLRRFILNTLPRENN
ncbi:IQ calmodulin binding motif [Trypanosoma vivax]|nr:hypothetical protein TRVL_04002 [Trypanosoma vivax]KAH8616670.1 IQ calmodulin binding motif [Trypanosoma vivax]